MALTSLPFIDYTSRDYETIRRSLLEYLRQRFPDDFTDFSESQLGIALIELTAYAYSITSYMLDRQVNEVFIDTARERKSIAKIASFLGYKLLSAQAATIELVVATGDIDSSTTNIVVAKGTRIDVGTLRFEIDQVYTLSKIGNPGSYIYLVNGQAAAGNKPTIAAVEGETVVETSVATSAKYQQITVSRFPYITDSCSVVVGSTTWVRVNAIVLGDPDNPSNQNIYEVITDQDDILTIRFGDGLVGSIPLEGSTITITYRVGGGVAGNIAARAISGQSLGATNDAGSVTLTVTNERAGYSGAERESIERARIFAPAYARTTDRAVTYNDYFALCNGYTDGANGVIAKAGIIADPTDGISNVVTVYVWGVNDQGDIRPAPVSQVELARWNTLKSALATFLERRRTLATYVKVLDGRLVSIDVEASIVVNSGFKKEVVKAAVGEAIRALFREERVRYGNELRLGWLYEAIAAVPGVISSQVVRPSPLAGGGGAIVVKGVSVPIESGTLQAAAIAGSASVQILAGGGTKPDNFYNNYRLWIRGAVYRQTRRILGFTQATGSVALESGLTYAVNAGDTWEIVHPRRIALDASASSQSIDYVNRAISLDASTSTSTSPVLRTILAYSGSAIVPNYSRVAVVDKDWDNGGTDDKYAVAGRNYTITSDVRCNDAQAIVLGNLIINFLF